MSSVSASGVGMLVFLILIGPFIYLVKYLYEEYILHKHAAANVIKTDDGRENLSSKAYLFALIGYAIGIGKFMCILYTYCKLISPLTLSLNTIRR